jgi:hypothetical protein
MGIASTEDSSIWDRRRSMIECELEHAMRSEGRARAMYTVVGWPAAVLSTLVSTAIFASDSLRLLSGCAAALVAVLTATNAFFNPQDDRARAGEQAHALRSLLLDLERTTQVHNDDASYWIKQLERIDRRYEQITGDCYGGLARQPAR